ncbi:MAG: 6,7-dimethyl-8-ribityllumazine synthase [Firmicutes bacterium]|jgi:6,7-dimethyl-8-ribityllumazine synthase|nr:6,7-dimethyl-8-ribityllumazine synthase [Bacillota bacterium]
MIFNGNYNGENKKVAIVAARFNEFITSKLIGGAKDALVRHNVKDEDIDILWVPGAFEIPQIAQMAAKNDKYDAVITLGAVIRGETPHFDYVCAEVSKGVAHISMDVQKPVMFGVLTCNTTEEAIARAGTKAGNKGFDVAMGAIEMMDLIENLK